MFGVFKLAYALIMLVNSMVILNEKRFLRKVGLPLDHEARKCLGHTRAKVARLLRIIRTTTRIPLIILNIVCILYEIFLG